jgi:hypothetical protein
VDDYRAEYEAAHPSPAWHDQAYGAWHDAFKAACRERLQVLDDSDDAPELIEGYEYQSNASGTGIVDVGHYAWMREVEASDITFARKDAALSTAKGG